MNKIYIYCMDCNKPIDISKVWLLDHHDHNIAPVFDDEELSLMISKVSNTDSLKVKKI